MKKSNNGNSKSSSNNIRKSSCRSGREQDQIICSPDAEKEEEVSVSIKRKDGEIIQLQAEIDCHGVTSSVMKQDDVRQKCTCDNIKVFSTEHPNGQPLHPKCNCSVCPVDSQLPFECDCTNSPLRTVVPKFNCNGRLFQEEVTIGGGTLGHFHSYSESGGTRPTKTKTATSIDGKNNAQQQFLPSVSFSRNYTSFADCHFHASNFMCPWENILLYDEDPNTKIRIQTYLSCPILETYYYWHTLSNPSTTGGSIAEESDSEHQGNIPEKDCSCKTIMSWETETIDAQGTCSCHICPEGSVVPFSYSCDGFLNSNDEFLCSSRNCNNVCIGNGNHWKSDIGDTMQSPSSPSVHEESAAHSATLVWMIALLSANNVTLPFWTDSFSLE